MQTHKSLCFLDFREMETPLHVYDRNLRVTVYALPMKVLQPF